MNADAPSERTIQRAILRRMAQVLPADAVWLHVPNQGPNPDFTKALLGDGLKPGCPDLLLFHAGRAFGLEVKRPKEYPDPVQREFHGRLEAAGVPVAVVRSVQDAEAAWTRWGLPMATPVAAAPVSAPVDWLWS